MATKSKRTPIHRAVRRQITPAAVEAFERMEKLRTQCTCPPIDWAGEYWKRGEPCGACDEWWQHHSALHRAVGAKPWEWPAFEYPDAVNPYPTNSPAAAAWDRDRAGRPDAFGLYSVLKEAAASAAQAKRGRKSK
jgi:hypothetical protein